MPCSRSKSLVVCDGSCGGTGVRTGLAGVCVSLKTTVTTRSGSHRSEICSSHCKNHLSFPPHRKRASQTPRPHTSPGTDSSSRGRRQKSGLPGHSQPHLHVRARDRSPMFTASTSSCQCVTDSHSPPPECVSLSKLFIYFQKFSRG